MEQEGRLGAIFLSLVFPVKYQMKIFYCTFNLLILIKGLLSPRDKSHFLHFVTPSCFCRADCEGSGTNTLHAFDWPTPGFRENRTERLQSWASKYCTIQTREVQLVVMAPFIKQLHSLQAALDNHSVEKYMQSVRPAGPRQDACSRF